MIVPAVAAGITVGGKLLGNVIASVAAEKKAAEAQRLRDAAYRLMDQYQVPSLEDLIPLLEKIDPAKLQELSPFLQAAEQVGDSQMAGIQLDPAYQDAQKQALAKMLSRGEEGLTTSEEVARNEIINQAGQAEKGAQEAVLQSMARRGMLGSGSELAARLAGTQNAFDRASREASDLAAARDERAFKATQAGGEQAQGMENAQYQRGSDLARARDTIAAFNASQRTGANQSNMNAKNQAQEFNVGAQNKAYLANVDLSNKAAKDLVAAREKAAELANDKLSAQASAKLGAGTNAQAAGAAAATQIGGNFSGAGEAVGSLVNMFGNKVDEDEKKKALTKVYDPNGYGSTIA